MIILFQFIVLITKYLVTTLSKSFNDKPDAESKNSEHENPVEFYQESIGSESRYLNGELKFCPPVYVQRYEAVFSILHQSPFRENIKKVVDFGCSDLGFFLSLKHLPGVEEILEIDIDENALDRGLSKAAPLNSDYLFCKRAKPLNVYIMSGSIAEYDDCLLGTDVVVAIEVIEHLFQDVLDEMPHNVFHEIRPKIAIFTTPNADFNALFPKMTGFRHPDHKFEWTRREFYKWTEKILKKYPCYSVKFYGIGIGPFGSENLGCCTQMAVFTRNDAFEEDKSILKPKGANKYKLIRKYEYPFFVDKRTDEEKILDEVTYRVKFTMNEADYYNYEDCSTEFPLAHLLEYISEWCNSEERLKKILLDHGFHVKERDGCNVLVYFDLSNTSYGEDEERSVEFNITEEFPIGDHPTENWDLDYVDGNFNVDNVPDEELISYLTARSLQETDSSLARSELSGAEQGMAGDGKSNYNTLPKKFSNDISSGKYSKYATLGRIPKKKKKIRETLLRNPSRNLKSWIQAQMGSHH